MLHQSRSVFLGLCFGLGVAGIAACSPHAENPGESRNSGGSGGGANGAGGSGAAGGAGETGAGGYAADPPEVIHDLAPVDCRSAEVVPVPVDGGSYSICPPKGILNNADTEAEVQSLVTDSPIYAADLSKPLPTNDWWTSLLVEKDGGQVWAYPLVVRSRAYGVDVSAMGGYAAGGENGMNATLRGTLQVGGSNFSPKERLVTGWSDWLVDFTMRDGDKSMKVTTGHGLPFVWIELSNTTPVLTLAGSFTTFDDAGNTTSLPATGDHIGLSYDGRFYGLFAPDGTTFTQSAGTIQVQPGGSKGYLVIGELKGAADLPYYHGYAYAVPRDSRVDWKFSPEASHVKTTWSVKAENLKGEAQLDVLQGFIPHHYRKTDVGFAFDGHEYFTPRGTMKLAAGQRFEIAFPFHGFVPQLPAPEAVDAQSPYDPGRMRQQVEAYAMETGYGADTYWGGKDLIQYGKYMHIAHEIGDTASFETLKQKLRAALEDWFTYTPGEKEHFFSSYYRWKGLVGFQPSYGSQHFTDHHFHYGYFTYASALLGMYDKDFLDKYGAMATLVAKEYANYNREDQNFPMFRTLDPWMGHSYAGGRSNPTDGNNQESSSEAMQSWGGLFLLGTMLGNDRMRNAGAFGYAMEAQGCAEYWFDRSGQNFPPEWTHGIATVVRSEHIGYWTYFSGDPIWKHAILWLPMSPLLNYLVEDYDYARAEYEDVMAQMAPATVADWGSGLGNVVLSFRQMFDPDAAAKELDDLWAANSDVVHNVDTGGITYFYTHSNRRLGRVQWTHHTSIPTGTVYYNEKLGEYSYVVYNPKDTEETCNVYEGRTLRDSFPVPARSLFTKRVKAN